MHKFQQSKWSSLLLSNFLGVFNDNLLKNSVIFISISWALPVWLTQSQLITLVSASLILPYLIFSPYAGKLSVIYSKKKIFVFFKMLEIPIMMVACVAFYFEWVALSIFSVLLMGIQSSLYSPSKYGLIRDIGGEEGVSYGSGVFETMAFLGILIGTIVGSFISDLNIKFLEFILFLGVAILGYVVTKSIRAHELPEDKEYKETINPIKYLKSSFQIALQYKYVNSAVFGAASFWMIGGMLQMNLVIHSKQFYQTSNTTTGIIMSFAAIGIALGCWFAGKISGGKVLKGLILIGISGMTILLILLAFVKMSLIFFTINVFLVAFLGGFFQIPCLALIQQSNLGRKLGEIIAYLNLVTFIFVLLGTLIYGLTNYLSGENSFIVFGVIAILCFLVSVYFILSSPIFLKDTIMLFRNKKNIVV